MGLIAATRASTAPAIDALRLSLHVTAAAVWVGGQLTVAGLLPTLRGLGADAPRAVARAFARLLWPAYAVLIATGVWNVAATSSGARAPWNAVLGVKVIVVLGAGLAAWLHTRATSRTAVAATGAAAGLLSVTALVLGVVLGG